MSAKIAESGSSEIIAREDLLLTVDATDVIFTPASWRIFSRRRIS
jgi:hypothetical protein